ncbi:MAG: DUF7619 domain-containing protein, partial [Thermoplasmata archaeon]
MAASKITFTKLNGTYIYNINSVQSYTSSPSSGSITVNGSSVNTAITFTLVKTSIIEYTITFSESGLSAGASWSVALNGNTESSTTNTITFTEPNGSYSYKIDSIIGYTVYPSSGTITVNGVNITQAITFTANITTYTITFTESGLPAGASWSVTLNGVT